ncbi:hypothetical protein [Streptomyces europaeiscabiei]|uniref:hypothetical protein n=1 Tax=Streptomyces europaeiscabiei TaxID=146819 RepID=UPI0029A782F0|nr:hypothetical protein [Streptomyces europaeiscabiei]MDX2770331.1 hypothetical protein [Streptomyces europaeiscabiei]
MAGDEGAGAWAAVVEVSSRAAAKRLAADHGLDVVDQVEDALHDLEWEVETDVSSLEWEERGPQQYALDPIALGSLIVSVATAAWTVYQDLAGRRRDAATPPPVLQEAVVRQVRLQIVADGGGGPELGGAVQERLCEVVVEEVLRLRAGMPPDRPQDREDPDGRPTA